MRVIRQGSGGKMVHTSDVETGFSLPEISAIIGQNGENLVVNHIMEEQIRPKGYEKTEMKEGDIILMADGKKIVNLDDFKKRYHETAVGSMTKLGIKRDNAMMIVSFVKADPKSLPVIKTMTFTGKGEDMFVIPQIGLSFGGKGKSIVIKDVFPDMAKDQPKITVKEGDAVTTFNGLAIKSFKTFREKYEKLPVGEKVELIFDHSGEQQTITFVKQKDAGRVIIRR